MRYRYFILFFAFITFASPLRAQNVVTFNPSKDNTLYESATGAFSNGAGDAFFAGKTASGAIRRAVLAFDVSSIPAGATIQSVRLTLRMSKTISGAQNVALHRLTADWGEGASNAGGNEGSGGPSATGDATWIHRSFNTDMWQQAGGDFDPAVAASVSVNAIGSYTWGSTSAMVSDVKGWVDDPASNFGWILVGNEGGASTAKRFDSRESITPANRPVLEVTYLGGVAVEEELPTRLVLGRNYPDPFSSESSIPFELDAPRHVTLAVYDVLGRRMRTLADGILPQGPHRVDVSAAGLPAGLYAYCLTADEGRQCRTMLVAR